MPGKVIGETLGYGFAGTPSMMSDCVIAPYLYPATETTNIEFGYPVALATTGDIANVTGSSDKVIGVAVRHLGQPHADNNNGWYYAPGDTVDVLKRGAIVVTTDGTATTAGAAAYFNYTTKKFTATSTGAVAVGVFTTGKVDANGMAEITLATRAI